MLWITAAALVTALWAHFALGGALGSRRLPRLRDFPSAAPEASPPRGSGISDSRAEALCPRVSVVVPARNEERGLRACLESLLAQDWPHLEVIAVDDRSTDATGRIADEIAGASGGRLRAIHVAALPEGWLGKCHAMHVGAAHATGQFLLFTDGDILFAPTVVSRAVTHAAREGLDLLTIVPGLIMPSLWERAMVYSYAVNFSALVPLGRIENPRSGAYAGVGAFNLVRREVYERAGGHRPLRLHVIDDMALGLLIKSAGGRVRLALGEDLLRVRWQDSLGGMVRGFEKNAFAAFEYRVGRAAALIAAMLAVNWWPVVGLFAGPPVARLLCGVTWLVLMPLTSIGCRRLVGLGWPHAFLAPLGATFLAYASARSVMITLRRGGVRWRDSFYPLATLRAALREFKATCRSLKAQGR